MPKPNKLYLSKIHASGKRGEFLREPSGANCGSHEQMALLIVKAPTWHPLFAIGMENTMQDFRAAVERLREEAAEAARIRDRATDSAKRDIFNRLHEHLNRLADDVEQAKTAGTVPREMPF